MKYGFLSIMRKAINVDLVPHLGYNYRYGINEVFIMSKSAYVRARIEPDLKIGVEAIFSEFGVTPTQVITMLYKQVLRNHEIPIDLSLPNRETAKAIEEARNGEGIVKCKDVDDLFNQLGI